MLANTFVGAGVGSLEKDVHKPSEFMYELLDFIRLQLPIWRDRADRRIEVSETTLTSQLCAHLNSAARHSEGWDILQFRTEEPDRQKAGRKVDLAPAPCDTTIVVDGRRYSDFDALLPIECKRLPTPVDSARDEREYVFSSKGSTGGIQRFKAGNHGGGHKIGAMIAYIQKDTVPYWAQRIADWIKGLVAAGEPIWTLNDVLNLKDQDNATQTALLLSVHDRQKPLPIIELRHLWIVM